MFFIFFVCASLCTVPLCPAFQNIEEPTHEDFSLDLHEHSHDGVEVAQHSHDGEEHVHRHSHGPGQPEHEHGHEHSSSPAPTPFPLLATNPGAPLIVEPDADLYQFSFVTMNIPGGNFLQGIFRPPILFA